MNKILILILLLSSSSYSGEIYKWVDKDGRVHYGDSKNTPDHAKTEKVKVKVNTYNSPSFATTNIDTSKVVMYSAEWCGVCKTAKKYFISNNIPFIEYDVDKDKQAMSRYRSLGAKGVPVILYKKQRMNGFSVNGFKRLYQGGA